MFDIKITGGTVVDGTGGAGRRADVGITGDRIEAIGDLSQAEAGRTIDAGGLTVSPGFIDTHVHSDAALLTDPQHARGHPAGHHDGDTRPRRAVVLPPLGRQLQDIRALPARHPGRPARGAGRQQRGDFPRGLSRHDRRQHRLPDRPRRAAPGDVRVRGRADDRRPARSRPAARPRGHGAGRGRPWRRASRITPRPGATRRSWSTYAGPSPKRAGSTSSICET